jgi:predicted thioesterase
MLLLIFSDMLYIALKHQSVMRVMDGNTAEFIGSGDMAVLATPAMVALMENAAMLAVALKIEEGETTVGSMISTSHLKPSKIGNTISAIAELTEIDGRKLTFKISAYDGDTLIGEGEHIRYIVNRDKFLSKL